MTQTPEMPNSLFLSPGLGGIVGFEQFPTSTEYIRRAVSKEDAGEIDANLTKAVAEDSGSRYAEFVRKYYPLIRKLTEAHK